VKKFLIFFVVVIVVGGMGFFVYRALDLGRYGIAGSTPIGTYEKLDAHLQGEIGLRKKPLERLNNKNITPAAQMFRYGDPNNEYEYIVLLLDGQNNLQGMAGWYMTPGDQPTRSRIRLFMRNHWGRCGGAKEPQFSEIKQRAMIFRLAQFTDGPVTGEWQTSRNDSSGRNPTFERIYLAVK
jgi:hypothetical protein